MPFTQDEIDNMRSNGVTGLSDAPTDRETLEAVLARYTGTGLYRPHEIRILVDAARKHLETLPKTRTEWRVSYSEGGETRTWRTVATEAEAQRSGAYALCCGKSCVSINSYQVPA